MKVWKEMIMNNMVMVMIILRMAMKVNSEKQKIKMKVWEEMRAVLPEEVTGDWGHFVEIFGRFFVLLPSIVIDLIPHPSFYCPHPHP